MSLSVSFRWRLCGLPLSRCSRRPRRPCSPIETTTGLPVFSLKSRMLWCISSLAVTPPPGELTSSTTATTLVSCAACAGVCKSFRRGRRLRPAQGVICSGYRTLDGHDGYRGRSVAGHVLSRRRQGEPSGRPPPGSDYSHDGQADQTECHETPDYEGPPAPSSGPPCRRLGCWEGPSAKVSIVLASVRVLSRSRA